MSRGLSDLHYTTPTVRFHRLIELAALPEFEFDLISAVEARKFGVRSEVLHRLVQHVRGMSPEELSAEYDSLAKIEG
jgi:hypothetical protein